MPRLCLPLISSLNVGASHIQMMQTTEKGSDEAGTSGQRDIMRVQAVTGLCTAGTRAWRGQTGGCNDMGGTGGSHPLPDPRTLQRCQPPRLGDRRVSPKRHKSLQENWLALKSQISEVAKIVAALSTFRTQ